MGVPEKGAGDRASVTAGLREGIAPYLDAVADYPPVSPRSRILAMNERILDWRLCGAALLAGAAVVAAALAMPVRLPDARVATDATDRLPAAAAEAEPEDLSAFLEIRRWGPPPEEPKAPEPELPVEAEPALNPVLAEMGFVGLIASQDELAVLLMLPEGETVRMLPGDTLPDGRILVSVADNSLTLQGEGMPAEVLTLFPRLPAEAGASGEAPGEGDSAGAGAAGAVTSQ